MSEIELCPFCGKPFEVVEWPDDGTAYWKHNSVNCPMHREGESGYLYISAEGMAEDLNARAFEPILRARIAQLEAHLKDRDTWLKNNRDYIDELEKKIFALKRELSTAETNTAANTIFMARKEIDIAQLKAAAVDDKFKIMCLERHVKELEAEVKSWESTH